MQSALRVACALRRMRPHTLQGHAKQLCLSSVDALEGCFVSHASKASIFRYVTICGMAAQVANACCT